jgi:branched-chain amino acid transport system substrate-binding protein
VAQLLSRVVRARSCAALLFALALAACGGGSTIKIGVVGNFEDPLSAPIRYGARLAVEEINAAGGINGRQIELVEREDYGNADSAVVVATDLYTSEVVAVVGHGFSGPTLAAAPVYNGGDNPVLEIAPASSAPSVTEAGPYTFRLCPSDLAHGAALARWGRQHLNLNRAAVLYLNDDYGRGIRQAFEQEFIALQGEVTASLPYLGNIPDITPYMDRLARDSRAQFIVVAGYDSDAKEIITQARQRDIKIPVMGGDGLEQIWRAGAVAEGTYATSSYFASVDTPANNKFAAAYAQRYPDAGPPNGSGAASYDAIYMLKNVISRVGTGRKKVRDAFAEIGRTTPAYAGAMGTLAFDENGDVPSLRIYMGVVRGGSMLMAEGQ